MGASAIQEQRDSEQSRHTLKTTTDWHNSNLGYNQKYNSRRCRSATRNCPDLADFAPQWKVLVIDEGSKKILDNVVKEDDILNENIASMWHAGDLRINAELGQILSGLRRGGK
jgi:hypothetical protein